MRWRKSSYSSGQGGNCVELRWRKSSHSSGQDGNCVELAHIGMIRDSKNPGGPILSVRDLPAFLRDIKERRQG